MEYRSTREMANQWGVSLRNVQRLLAEGRIPGAKRFGGAWFIPADSKKPLDPRRARRLARSAPPSSPRLLPLRCPILAMTTLYQKPGEADKTVASLAGDPNAQALFAAQLAYFRGHPDRAAAQCRELLTKTSCFDTVLGCQIMLASAALYRGDCAAWQEARTAVAETVCLNEDEGNMRDFCLAAVDSALYDRRSYPQWLKIGCFDLLPIDAFPAARYYFAKHLAICRASFDTVRMLEPLCAQSRAEGAVAAELYLRLITAIGCHDGGDNERAAVHLSRALDLALPDRLYAPLAEARRNIGTMLDTALQGRSGTAFRAVAALYERLMPAWAKLYQNRMERSFALDLTLREGEAAKYAALGMSNEEIAAKMQLSVHTVRDYISSALQKTGLSDRSEFLSYLTMS